MMRGNSRGAGNRGNGRQGFRGRLGFRGTGLGSNDNASQLAMQIATGHQCNNLSFETKDPATKDSRIYVGNICKNKVSRRDLFVIFSKYGTITAISHLSSRTPSDNREFAFVQFTTRESAEKAVISEGGQGYYGYSLDVKLADFRVGSQSQGSRHSSLPRGPSKSQSGPLFSKRPATDEERNAPTAKKRRMDQGPPPDILVCGVCHEVFSGIESMIRHKREPCKSVKKCRCDEENIPDVVTCAICFYKLASPWQLIVHTRDVHNITICDNIEAGASTEVDEVIGEEEFTEVVDGDAADGEVDLDDIDNGLMEEEEQ